MMKRDLETDQRTHAHFVSLYPRPGEEGGRKGFSARRYDHSKMPHIEVR